MFFSPRFPKFYLFLPASYRSPSGGASSAKGTRGGEEETGGGGRREEGGAGKGNAAETV